MPSSWWAISRPRNFSVTLTLSPSFEEAVHGLHLHLIIMGVDVGAHLDFLDLGDLLLLARLGAFFLVRVFQLAEIEDLAHPAIGVRCDLYEVETGLVRHAERPGQSECCPSSGLRHR